MEKIKNTLSKLIVCAAEAAVGVILLIDPEGFTRFVLIAAGILLCALGALAVIRYFGMDPTEAALSQGLVRGLISLAIGVLIVYNARWIVYRLASLTILYGVAALLAAIVKLQWTVDMARLKTGVWQSAAVASALSIILAVIILTNPFAVRRALWTFSGVTLIITAISTFLSAILQSKN